MPGGRQEPGCQASCSRVGAARRWPNPRLLVRPIDLAGHFPSLAIKETKLLVAAGQHRAEQLSDFSSRTSIRLAQNILRRVVVKGGQISIELVKTALAAELLGQEKLVLSESETIELTAPLLIAWRGSEVRLILENGEPSDAKPIPSLTKAIAWSRIWSDRIVKNELVTMEDLARSAGVSKIHARRVLRCAALSPHLTAQILEGRHPVNLSLQKLTRNLPLDWEQQQLA
jgi:site-specific DNA recombinase